MWLAREKNGRLQAFNSKPTYFERLGIFCIPVESEIDMFNDDTLWLDRSEFPEVTFENSPIEIVTLSK